MKRSEDPHLLQAVLAYLTMGAPFCSTRRRRSSWRALVGRLFRRLEAERGSQPGRRALDFARTHLAGERLRIDPDEDLVREEAESIWVRAWVRVDRDDVVAVPPEMRAGYIRIVNALPLFTREAFLLLRIDGLGYDEIATRLGISRGEVEGHIRTALAEISAALETGQ